MKGQYFVSPLILNEMALESHTYMLDIFVCRGDLSQTLVVLAHHRHVLYL